MSAKNKEIKKAIDSLDLDEARKLIKTALKQNPDADTYYYASLVALNDSQKKEFLNKAVGLDPFHKEANTELGIESAASQNPATSHKQPNKTTPNGNNGEKPKNKFSVFIPGVVFAIISIWIFLSAISQDYYTPTDCNHIDAFSNPTGYEICINSMIEQNETTKAYSQILFIFSSVTCGVAILAIIAGYIAFSRSNKKEKH